MTTLAPRIVLLEPVIKPEALAYPTAVLLFQIVLKLSEATHNAVLLLPVVLA
jgi:hypothetical protein